MGHALIPNESPTVISTLLEAGDYDNDVWIRIGYVLNKNVVVRKGYYIDNMCARYLKNIRTKS